MYILKNLLRFFPLATAIFLLLFVQLLFLGVNIVGIVLFARLYSYREVYRTIIAASLTSLLYDAIKMVPLGSWSLSFCLISIVVLLFFQIVKIQQDNKFESWPSLLLLIFIVAISALAQSFILFKMSGGDKFDFNITYSIVFLSALYISFLKLTHKKERRLLLD